ncbi:MAG: PEGA domain-containing protein [Calditrichales bacterium]|nr:MAG: PEGA domain-containing protein [Calditrichales bacterium]
MSFLLKKTVLLFLVLTFFSTGYAQEKNKLRIAILDFNNTGGLSKQETVTLGNRLRSMLVKTNAFVVLERGQMDEVLNEQGFQQTGCTTTECAVEMGRMLNVQKMISGSIGKLGKTYTIDLSLIDVQTAQIEKSFFRDFKGEIDGLLSMMQSIADQIGMIGASGTAQKPADEKVYDLNITSTPSGANLFINDREAGRTPFSSKAREGLSILLRVEQANYKSWEKTVVIRGDLEVEAELEPLSIVKPASTASAGEGGGISTWVWIGGAAVLAGGAAALLLSGSSTTEEQPTPAEFPAPPARP